LTNVRKVAIGESHACAVFLDDELRCWGANSSGEVTGRADLALLRTPVKAGAAVASVVVGDSHTCALLKDGSVRCFGDDSQGQLGSKSPSNDGDSRVAGMPRAPRSPRA